MFKTLISSILLLFCSTVVSAAMTAEQIRTLAGEPHDRENILPELSLYPDARTYEGSLTLQVSGEADEPAEVRFTATEKVVRGRYIVTTVRYEGQDAANIMVVTYDADESIHRKWVLGGDGEILSLVGTADIERRVISWITTGGDLHGMSIESHSDEKISWRDVLIADGDVALQIEGTARKTE